TPADYDAYTSAVLQGANPAAPQARELNRFFFANSLDTELDGANRVMIPTNLIEYAGLSKDVTVIGAGQCLEVFDRAAYEAYSKGVVTRVPEITASLGHTS